MADRKISELEQITSYDSTTMIPVSTWDGYNYVNKKIAVEDVVIPGELSALLVKGNEISGGTITGSTIVSNSLSSTNITALNDIYAQNNVSAGVKVSAPYVSGDNISGTTIEGDIINGDVIVGSNGEFDVLEVATSIKSYNSISGDTIVGETSITSPLIQGSVISGTSVTSPSIQGSSISGTSITTPTLNATGITATDINANSITLTGGIGSPDGEFGTLTITDNLYGVNISGLTINSSNYTGTFKGTVSSPSISGTTISTPSLNATNANIANNVDASSITSNIISGTTITTPSLNATGISGSTIIVDSIGVNSISGGDVSFYSINSQKLNVDFEITGDTITGKTSISSPLITGTNVIGNSISGTTVASPSFSGTNMNIGTLNASTSVKSPLVSGTTITSPNISGTTITGDLFKWSEISGSTIIADSIGVNSISGGDASFYGLQVETGITSDTISGNTITSLTGTTGLLNITGRVVQGSAGSSSNTNYFNNTIVVGDPYHSLSGNGLSIYSDGGISPRVIIVKTSITTVTGTCGTATYPWKDIYSKNALIVTSDARLKTEVSGFTINELNASKELAKEIGIYKFLSSIEEKGDNARKHIGMTVQKAIEIMENNNLNPFEYGFICYDEWDEKTEEDFNENETPEIRQAGNKYSFRYEELLSFIARGFEERLSLLESKIG